MRHARLGMFSARNNSLREQRHGSKTLPPPHGICPSASQAENQHLRERLEELMASTENTLNDLAGAQVWCRSGPSVVHLDHRRTCVQIK